MALEPVPHNVTVNTVNTVNTVAPGSFANNMANGVLDDSAADALLSRIPIGRFTMPDAVVGPAAFLASAASDYRRPPASGRRLLSRVIEEANIWTGLQRETQFPPSDPNIPWWYLTQGL